MQVLPGKTTLNWSECKSYEDILFHNQMSELRELQLIGLKKEMHLCHKL